MDKKQIKENLQTLALKSMFTLNEEELEYAYQEYIVFMKQVEQLQEINTDGVEVMTFPYDIKTTYLRKDEPIHISNRDELLSNSNDVVDHQIRVVKVVG